MEIKFRDNALLRLKKVIQISLEQNDKSSADIEYLILTPQEVLELGDNISYIKESNTHVLRNCNIQGINLYKIMLDVKEEVN